MTDVCAMLEKLLSLADENLIRNGYLKREDIVTVYARALHDEVAEALGEMKRHNTVYLEDELGDVLWVYVMLLKVLVRDGYITSIEKVFRRSFEKFSERYESVFDLEPEKEKSEKRAMVWQLVKERQKEKLRQEHAARHGPNTDAP